VNGNRLRAGVLTAALFLLATGSAAGTAPGSAERATTQQLFTQAVAVQPDGKVLLAVGAYICDGGAPCRYGAFITRYAGDGTVDRAFGQDGTVAVEVGADVGVSGLVVQEDGRIVVGLAEIARPAALLRLLPNGLPDPSFGTDGLAESANPEFFAGGPPALAADGRIIVPGSVGAFPDGTLAVEAFDEDGGPASGFGAGGVASTFGGPGTKVFASSAAVRDDGRIVASGSATGIEGTALVVSQFEADGTVDGSFGDGGTLKVPGGRQSAGAAALLRSGDLVIPGSAVPAPGNIPPHGDYGSFVLTQVSPLGEVDREFGSDGSATVGGSLSASVALEARDGKILGLGNFSSYGKEPAIAVARFTRRGEADGFFAPGGGRLIRVGGFFTEGVSAAIAGNGDVVVGTRVNVGGDRCPGGEFFCPTPALIRFKASGALRPKFGKGGVVTAPFVGICRRAPLQGCGDALDDAGEILDALVPPRLERRPRGFRMPIECDARFDSPCRIAVTARSKRTGEQIARGRVTMSRGAKGSLTLPYAPGPAAERDVDRARLRIRLKTRVTSDLIVTGTAPIR